MIRYIQRIYKELMRQDSLSLGTESIITSIMQTSHSQISGKPSEDSSQNTRDISLFDVSKAEISLEECIQLDCSSPLKDLDRGGQKIPYSEAIANRHKTLVGAETNINDRFFTRFKEEFSLKIEDLFKSVKKGDIQSMRKIMKQHPVPVSVRQQKPFNNTLLHQSIKYSQIEISLLLISMDATLLNEENNEGRTPVHYALMYARDLFLGLLSDYIEEINWAATDTNQVTYADYLNYYQYDSAVCQKIKKQANKGLEKTKSQKSFLDVPSPNSKSKSSYLSIPVQTQRARLSRSSIQLKKGNGSFILSSTIDPRQNIFSSETNLSDFIILSELGEGAFAKVYKIKHVSSGEIYAMKVFLKKLITHQTIRYIMSQKDLLMRLNHPFLVKVYCSFETPHLYCYVMECCEGTLRDFLSQQEELAQNTIKLIACQLVSVLGYLHRNSVIYRDLKPQNVGYDQNGHIRLLDFGLAKDDCVGRSFCGSYLYLPPQIISSKQYSFPADWYMLGVLLYELSSGKTPFIQSQKEALLKAILKQKNKPLLGVSNNMSDLIDQLLEKDQQMRLGSMNDDSQIMDHPWFDDIEWDSIPKRRYKIRIPSDAPFNQTDSINQDACAYFQNILVHSPGEYGFIEVPRWTSVKKLA